jgi:fructose-1,6-bisphosphatase/inositol monophosphatase family enzyme
LGWIAKNADVTKLTLLTFLAAIPLFFLSTSSVLALTAYAIALVPLTIYHHRVDNPVIGFRKNAHRMVEKAIQKINEIKSDPRGLGTTTKEGGSLVTRADKDVQQLVIREIQKKYPGHYFIGEEEIEPAELEINERNKNSDYVWIMDPIDGTKPFSNGSDQWAISLALYHNGEPVLSTVWSPSFGWMECDRDRPGVYLNNKRFDSKTRSGAKGEPSVVISGDLPVSRRPH